MTRFTIICTLALLCAPSLANANPAALLFEGWFQIMLGSKKIGYSVERYEFKDNKFYAITYLKTNSDGNDVTESVKGISDAKMNPVSYEYTSKVGDQVKVIDAAFKADTMTLTIFDGKKKNQVTKRIKKGTFLSTMLMYIILNQKNGLKIGNDFKYNAIAEEDGTAYTGSLLVKNQEPVKGKPAIRILNEFKGEKYFSWVTSRGETLLVRQPERNVDLRFAETQGEATEGLTVNKKDLEILFGRVPGDAPKNDDTAPPPPSKFKSVKKLPGKAATAPDESKETEGVEIKGVPPPPPSSPQ